MGSSGIKQGAWNYRAGLRGSLSESVRLPAFIQPLSHRSLAAVRSRLQDILWDLADRRAASRRRRAERGVGAGARGRHDVLAAAPRIMFLRRQRRAISFWEEWRTLTGFTL